jgi:hypothetical protein
MYGVMSDSTLSLVITALLGAFVLAAIIGPLRGRRRTISVAPLEGASAMPPVDAAAEIAFDRATGKLTEADVAFLSERYATAIPVSSTSTAASAALAPGGFCHQCGAALAAGARFCHVCGTPTVAATAAGAVGSAPNDRQSIAAATAPDAEPARGGSLVPWAVAFVALLAVVAVLAGRQTQPVVEAAAGGAPNAPFANGASGPAPDISNMSPLERADRLFERIRAAAQQGDTTRVNTFLPMGLAAYDMIPAADKTPDARFAQATLAELAGAPELVKAQADTILAAAPTHLLGLILRVRAGLMQQDAKALLAARTALLQAQPGELAKPRPEYARFQGAIAQAVDDARQATGGKP